MPNIGAVLKSEISRLARREIKVEIASLRKASSQYRRDIAQLKRQVSKLQGKVSSLQKRVLPEVTAADSGVSGKGIRFSSKGLRSQRKRLGLSAADYGKLVGVGALTIYNWESGKSRPRKQHLPAIASIRSMRKREVQSRLEHSAKGKRSR